MAQKIVAEVPSQKLPKLAPVVRTNMPPRLSHIPKTKTERPTTEEMELKFLENEFARVGEALKRKREELAPRSEKERAAFLDAFTLGDDLDDERAVRAAGILLEWTFGVNAGVGSDDDKDGLARGIGSALSLVAEGIARNRRHVSRVANELASRGKELECVDLEFLAAELRKM